jgi:hypothetical protein
VRWDLHRDVILIISAKNHISFDQIDPPFQPAIMSTATFPRLFDLCIAICNTEQKTPPPSQSVVGRCSIMVTTTCSTAQPFMAPISNLFTIKTNLLLILLEAVSCHEIPRPNNREKACNFLLGIDPPLPRLIGLNMVFCSTKCMCCIRRCDLLPARPCQNLSQSTAT